MKKEKNVTFSFRKEDKRLARFGILNPLEELKEKRREEYKKKFILKKVTPNTNY
jgi:hypothetical protein